MPPLIIKTPVMAGRLFTIRQRENREKITKMEAMQQNVKRSTTGIGSGTSDSFPLAIRTYNLVHKKKISLLKLENNAKTTVLL